MRTLLFTFDMGCSSLQGVRLQGVQLSQLHQPSGRCILIGAIYSVGAVETTAPPWLEN